MSLDGVNVERLRKMVALLSSNQDGEVIAAVRAIGRVLEGAKRNWNDLSEAIGAGGGYNPFSGATNQYELNSLRHQVKMERQRAEEHRREAERFRKIGLENKREIDRLKAQLEEAYRSKGEESPPKQEKAKRENPRRKGVGADEDPYDWPADYLQRALNFVCACEDDLSDWEASFAGSIVDQVDKWGFQELSGKQRSKIVEVARRHGWAE